MPAANDRLRIVVMGWIVRGPMGGMAWHHLQYVLGLLRLGHDVVYIEDSGDYPACYHPRTMVTDADPTEGLGFMGDAAERLGFATRWAYYDWHTDSWHGPLRRPLERCRTSDVVINVSGVNELRPWLGGIPTRILIDTDPAFTQIRHLHDAAARSAAIAHTAFFSFGENVGTAGSSMPDDGIPWLPTRQPVVSEVWKAPAGSPANPLTTVMQWASYAGPQFGGRRYGMKADSFSAIEELPARVTVPLEIALVAPPDVGERLAARGWRLRDAVEVTRDPWSYRDYVQASSGELAVAKEGYVIANTGWFSERSAAYLAAGRPVVVQDTGFGAVLPTGRGILPFRNIAGCVAAIDDLVDNYADHAGAAEQIAETYFSPVTVLNSLLQRAHASADTVSR